MSNLFTDFYGMEPHKMLFGQNAIHIPINIIAQPMGDGKVIGTFQTSAGNPLLFGSDHVHQLILGDCVIRPRLVIGSNDFKGSGLSHLATNGFCEVDRWIETGKVIIEP